MNRAPGVQRQSQLSFNTTGQTFPGQVLFKPGDCAYLRSGFDASPSAFRTAESEKKYLRVRRITEPRPRFYQDVNSPNLQATVPDGDVQCAESSANFDNPRDVSSAQHHVKRLCEDLLCHCGEAFDADHCADW